MKRSVSAIIPVYNRRRQLLSAVQSVLEQTTAVHQLIVVDDGSEDDLSEVKDIVESKGHTFLRQKNLGVAAARNSGAAAATGDYLAFLDSDDKWLPQKIERQLEYFERFPGCRACQCNEIWFRNGVRVNPKKYHRMPLGDAFYPSLKRCVVSASSIMLERSLFEEIGTFDQRLIVCEDYDYWLRLSASHQIGLIGEELVEKFGGHADQLSRSQPVMDRFRVFAIVKLLRETSLNEQQRSASLEELAAKCEVVAAGAAKREKWYSGLYAELAAEALRCMGLPEDQAVAALEVFVEELLEAISVGD